MIPEIKLINGHWHVNEKRITHCNDAEVKFFNTFITLKKVQDAAA